MSMPKNVSAYEAEWGLIAQKIVEVGAFTIPVGDERKARYYRLRFYGFRSALQNHDAGNPWTSALLETQATIDVGGNLVLTRSPLSTLLRGLLEHSMVSDVSAAPAGPAIDAHESALLDYLNKPGK